MKSKESRRNPNVCAVLILAGCLATVVGLFFAQTGEAATAREIEVSVDVALERFYYQVKGAKKFTDNSAGLLILPNVKKAAFVVGGEYGEGALQIQGKTVDYYNMVSGSVGLQIGAAAKDIVLVFMTEDALKGFQTSNGWQAGVDGNIAFVQVGAGQQLDTITLKTPIVGFVFDAKGIIADISLKGAKLTKLNKEQ